MNSLNIRWPLIGLGAVVVLLILFGSSLFFKVGNGERAVIYRIFKGGLDKEKVFGEGLHVKAPWNKVFVYDVKIQEREETMDVLSSNGLAISIDVSFRFMPLEAKVGYLHNEIGTDFSRKIIIPEIRSSTRKVIGRYTPEELYSSKRDVIQEEIMSRTEEVLSENYIHLDALLIRSVQLPETIKKAIESKLQQEQMAQEYEFRIMREQKESERKQIEAQGIQLFQDIVSEGISDKLLKWKGIEATQALAASPNSKVIVIGSGKDGLPIILGGN